MSSFVMVGSAIGLLVGIRRKDSDVSLDVAVGGLAGLVVGMLAEQLAAKSAD